MSTLEVSNLNDGTTTVGTTFITNGSAKSWVNFNGSGTIAARDSFNVSSFTDYASGQYAKNFTNNMNNADYSLAGQCSLDITGSTPTNYTALTVKQGSGYSTTSSCRVTTSYTTNTAGYAGDMEIVCLSILGDLA